MEFGVLLRSWRSERRMSQLDLANAVETPSRHISFLETGRSKPSRAMITRLAAALGIPLRERNVMLRAAGFADLYADHALSDDQMELLRQAVGRLIAAHEPFPSFVIDRQWNVLDANGPGCDILRLVESKFPFDRSRGTFNMIDALFGPGGFRDYIDNWENYARQYIQRLHREAATDRELREQLDRIRNHSDLPKDWWAFDFEYTAFPMLPIEMRINGDKLTFFTVVSAISLPTDALAQDLRVETMFPADDATEGKFQPAVH